MDIHGNLDLHDGQLRNARSHIYATLPAYDPLVDAGRVIYVNTGADLGFWFGDSDGSANWVKMSNGTTAGAWTDTAAILAGATRQTTLTVSGSVPQDGLITRIRVSSTLASGYVTVKLYNDAGRTDQIYEAQFDLASAVLRDRIPVSFGLDNTAGQIYLDVINNTGANGSFTVDIDAVGVVQVPVPAPPGAGTGINAGTAGDGLDYDAVNMALQVNLSANSGLELVGAAGDRTLQVDCTAGGGLTATAAGLECDATVLKDLGNQTFSGIKGFNSLRMVPGATPGAPVAGAHLAGEFYMDSNLDIWLCVSAGTPGSWVFYGWKESTFGGAIDGTSYTGIVAAGATTDLVLAATARRGIIRKLIVWGVDSVFGNVDVDAPFRVECYPNENYYGREMLWTLTCQARSTNFTGAEVAGATDLEVDTVSNVNLDDLARLRNAVVNEEYARVVVRTTVPAPAITVDETILYDYLATHSVMYCTEALELYWRNNSTVPANYSNIYLRFYNDDPAQAMKFGYHLHCEEIGGGLPI